MARSKDLKVWTNVSDDPVIGCGPDEWDSLMIAMNQVIKIDGRYRAVLHGTGTPQKPRQWNTTFAESTDLIHWKKLGPPVRPISENKSSGLLLNDGQTWRLYTMHHQVHLHTIK
jgi:sucrose-6-phosphate hydrolase SacC (GH32 family)